MIFMTHGFKPNTAHDFSVWKKFFENQNVHTFVHDFDWGWRAHPTLRATRRHARELKQFISTHLKNLPKAEQGEKIYVSLMGVSMGGLVVQMTAPDILPTLNALDMEPGNLMTMASPHGRFGKNLTAMEHTWFPYKLGIDYWVDRSFRLDAYHRDSENFLKDLPELKKIVDTIADDKGTWREGHKHYEGIRYAGQLHLTDVLKSEQYLDLASKSGRTFRKISMAAVRPRVGRSLQGHKTVTEFLEEKYTGSQQDFRSALEDLEDGMFQLPGMMYAPADSDLIFKKFSHNGAPMSAVVSSDFNERSDWLNLVVEPRSHESYTKQENFLENTKTTHGNLVYPFRYTIDDDGDVDEIQTIEPFKRLFFGDSDVEPTYPNISVIPQERESTWYMSKIDNLSLLYSGEALSHVYKVKVQTSAEKAHEFYVPGDMEFKGTKSGYLRLLQKANGYDDWLEWLTNLDSNFFDEWQQKVERNPTGDVSVRAQLFRRAAGLMNTDFDSMIFQDTANAYTLLSGLRDWAKDGKFTNDDVGRKVFHSLIQAHAFYPLQLPFKIAQAQLTPTLEKTRYWCTTTSKPSWKSPEIVEIAPGGYHDMAYVTWAGVKAGLNSMSAQIADKFEIPAEVITYYSYSTESETFVHDLFASLWNLANYHENRNKRPQLKLLLFKFVREMQSASTSKSIIDWHVENGSAFIDWHVENGSAYLLDRGYEGALNFFPLADESKKRKYFPIDGLNDNDHGSPEEDENIVEEAQKDESGSWCTIM